MKPLSQFVKWAFVAAFIIITNLFIYYAINLVHPEPVHENFCPIELQSQQHVSPESCVNAGGQWTNFYLSPKEITNAVQTNQPTGWCDVNFTCQKEFDSVTSNYNKNVFIAMIIISTVMVIGGVMMMSIEALSLGLVWSGVVSLLVATIRYWSDANNLIKVIILALAISALVWLATKKMNPRE